MSHYEKRLERDLGEIRDRVATIGRNVDFAVGEATRALVEQDRDLASRTILGDLPINRATREVDHLCHRFVAQHLPSARFLRVISSTLRMMIALERIGDYAVTVARESVQLVTAPSAVVKQDLSAMSDLARETLAQAMKAFNEEDEKLAWETMKRSRSGRESFQGVFTNLLAEGEGGGCPLADLFALQIVFNRLERIADLAKNICEEAVFVTTGEAKRPKTYRVLFLDEKNRFRSVLARAMAEQAYPESGHYECAGWEPAAEVDARICEALAAREAPKEWMKPHSLDTDSAYLAGFHVIVNLQPGVTAPIADLPFRTVLLDWSIEADLDEETLDEEGIERTGNELTRRIQDLMETLRGETAS